MPLTYHPRPGEILICDFSTGFRVPEIVKKRPVIVISPRRRQGELVTVVPLSSAEPVPLERWHYELPKGAYPAARSRMWAKCDIVMTVGLYRLDRVLYRDVLTRKRLYQTVTTSPAVLASVQAGVKAALKLD